MIGIFLVGMLYKEVISVSQKYYWNHIISFIIYVADSSLYVFWHQNLVCLLQL